MTTTASSLRDRLTAAAAAKDPYTRAVDTQLVAVDAHIAHRALLRDREQVLLALHRQHGWSMQMIDKAVGGGSRSRDALERLLADDTVKVKKMPDAPQRLEDLTGQLAELREVREEAVAAADQAWAKVKPPVVKTVTAPLPVIRRELTETTLERNQAAAALAHFHGWPFADTARIAGTSLSRLTDTVPDPHGSQLTRDEAGLRRRLLDLAARARQLTAERDWLAAGGVPALVVPLKDLYRQRNTIAKMKPGKARTEAATQLARLVRLWKSAVLAARTEAAASAMQHHKMSIEDIALAVYGRTSLNRRQLQAKIDAVGKVAKVPNAPKVLAQRHEEFRQLDSLLTGIADLAPATVAPWR